VEVAEETMAAAVKIGEYLIPHARAALEGSGQDVERAGQVLRWIRRQAVRRFSVRDAHRGVDSKLFPDAASVQAAVKLLGDHGYVRALPTPPPGPQGGHPASPRYEVHPDLEGVA
jgi:hypothetical protein